MNELEIAKCRLNEELDAFVEVVKQLTLDKTEIIVKNRNTCLDCSNWFESKDVCGFYKMKPPANIIVKPEGQCAEFTIDIPF